MWVVVYNCFILPWWGYFALGSWKEARTCLAKPMMSPWVGTFWSSGHQARVSTWWVHHLTHSWGSSQDGSGVEDLSDSFLATIQCNLVPDRNSCTSGSSSGGCPRSSVSSAHDHGGEPAASRLNLPPVGGEGAHFTSVSLLGLESSIGQPASGV